MFNLDKFLDKFKKIKPPINYIIIDIIKNELNVNIKSENILIKNNIIYIKTKPIIKSEVFIKKQKILELIKNKTNNNKFKDIK